MSRRPIDARRARGLSLIELMVALALGGILMGGAITLFVNNRATYEITNDMARLQENARFALETMAQDIRMAIHSGCNNDVRTLFNNLGFNAGELYDPTFFLEGLEQGDAAWRPTGHVGEADAIIAGNAPNYGPFSAMSDGITIRYLATNRIDADADGTANLEVIQSASGASPNLQVENLTLNFNVNQAAAIADCGSGDVFQVTAIDAPNNTVTANTLQRAYDPINRAMLATFNGVRYFVRNNEVGVPSLFRSRLSTNGLTEITDELVDGVESVQFLYGQAQFDTTGAGTLVGITQYDSAATVADWRQIASVRIGLLMRTVDEFGDRDTGIYDVVGTRICPQGTVANPVCDVFYPADRRRRRVFQTEVMMRNAR